MSCLAKECSQSHLADLNMSKTLQNLIFSRTSVRASRSRATRRCMTASTLSQFEKTPRENIQASNMRLWPELYRVSSLSRSQPQAGKYNGTDHGALQYKKIKAASAQVVSCCFYCKPPKICSTCMASFKKCFTFSPIRLFVSF